MKMWIAAAAASMAVPTAALACSCLATDDPAELRRMAPDVAKNAVALVEVETLVPFRDSNGAGDRMRVVRTLAGAAAAEFRVKRGPFPSGASCDLLFDKGQKAVVILYPADRPASDLPVYSISSLCAATLLEKPVFREAVERFIEKGSAGGERG